MRALPMLAVAACCGLLALLPSVAGAVPVTELLDLSKAGAPAEELIARIRFERTVFKLTDSQAKELVAKGLPVRVVAFMQRTPGFKRTSPSPAERKHEPTHKLRLRSGDVLIGIVVLELERRLVFKPTNLPVRHFSYHEVAELAPITRATRSDPSGRDASGTEAEPASQFSNEHRLILALGLGFAGNADATLFVEGIGVEVNQELRTTAGGGAELDLAIGSYISLGPALYARSVSAKGATERDTFVDVGPVLKLGTPLADGRGRLYLRVPAGLTFLVPSSSEPHTRAWPRHPHSK